MMYMITTISYSAAIGYHHSYIPIPRINENTSQSIPTKYRYLDIVFLFYNPSKESRERTTSGADPTPSPPPVSLGSLRITPTPTDNIYHQ
jgi:hypothetical protein